MISLNLLKFSIIVSKKAPRSIWAVKLAQESVALLRLVLDVSGGLFVMEFMLSVSKLAFVSISTNANLNPVFA